MASELWKRSMVLATLVVVLMLLPDGTVPVVQAQQSSDRTGAIIFPDELSTRYEQERETLAKEKRESSRRRTDEASDEWDKDDARYEYDNGSEEFYGLPVDYARQLSELNSTTDILNLLDPDSIDQRVFMDGGEYSGRDIGVNPVPASCEPDSQLVSLRPENLTSPRFYFYPSCTRVKRCSGCCNTNQLVCEPVANRTIIYKVNILEYRSGKRDKFSHLELVPVEEHVRCKCQCRVKEWHCTDKQVYNPNNCRCECTNKEDRNRCLQDRQIKQWNPNTCTCDCLPRNEECTSGSHFDRSACKCLPNEFYAYDGVASYWDHHQQQQQQQQRPISLARSAASG
ncbi:uncharacterized protein LOC128306654 isoform X2 [Anopheles moucheti]|uniref:uncharacterized protein LOC128306654 isoform X2 n=1 Tax=Anopheles moucheti TaxID=186751 RepID=UPI0022F0CFF7|nr:uncharacterized protein LOC128306654 isoform X2 [Anopheles moucheti]XP_052900190.1 uncharacterized protein LOC128306654 isoform X2 [Anopheles moucheti]